MTRKLLLIGVASLLCLLACEDVSAHPAWGIAVDRLGQVYFTDLKTVWKIDAQGKLSPFRTSSESHTHELNVDEAGNVYGAENSYDPATKQFFGGIWKKTPAGEFSYVLPLTSDIPEGTSIWRDREGNMYHVAVYRDRELLVLRRSPGGAVTVLAGSPNAARQYRQGVPYGTGGVAFGPDGGLYFVRGATISKLSTGGVVTDLASSIRIDNAADRGSTQPTQLFGLAVDESGSVFAADYGNRRVLKIAPNGSLSTAITGETPWVPTGVAAKGGNIYVLENEETPHHEQGRTRVRKISPDGSVAVLATVGGGTVSAEAAPTSASIEQSPVATNADTPRYMVATAAGVGVCILVAFAAFGLRRRSGPSH